MERRGELDSGDVSPPFDQMTSAGLSRPDVRFGLLVAILFFATLVPRIAVHVLWRDELEPWMIAVDGSPTFAELLHRASYEGHPDGWYVIQWLASKIWLDPMAMKLIHAAIAATSAFIIAAFAPATRSIRVLLLLGYFFSFEYAAISKNYAMGVTPLLAFAALRTWRESAFLSQAIALALAAQGNVLAGILAGILALWTGGQWLAAGRPCPGRFFTAVGIVSAGLLLAVAQLLGPPDRTFVSAGKFSWSLEKLIMVTGGTWRSFVPVPSLRRDWWNSNAVEDVFPFGSELRDLAVLGGVICLVTVWLLPARRGVRLLWVGGAGTLIAFGVFCYTGFLRHHGHLFILFLLAWWLGRTRYVETSQTSADRARRAAVVTLFVIQAIAGMSASVADVLLPFSASKATADYIKANYPDAYLMGDQDPPACAVAGHLGRAIYFPRAGRSGTFPIWNSAPRDDDFTAADLAAFARQKKAESPSRPILFIADDEYATLPDRRDFRLLARFQNSSIFNERFRVYLYEPRDTADATTRP